MTLKEMYAKFDETVEKVTKITEYYYNNNCDFKTFYKESVGEGFCESDDFKTLSHIGIRVILIQIMLTFVLPLFIISTALPNEQWTVKLPLTLFIGLGLNFISFILLKQRVSIFDERFNLMSNENIKDAKNNNDYESLLENEKQELDVLINSEEIVSDAYVSGTNYIELRIFNMFFGDLFTFYNLCLKYLNAQIYSESIKGLSDMVVSIIDTIDSDLKNDKNVIDSEDSIINYVNKKFDKVFIKSVFKNIIPSSNTVNHAIIIYYLTSLLEEPKLYDKFIKDDVVNIATNLILYKIVSYGLNEIENNLFIVDDSLRDLLVAG